jgi:hypothetical protein
MRIQKWSILLFEWNLHEKSARTCREHRHRHHHLATPDRRRDVPRPHDAHVAEAGSAVTVERSIRSRRRKSQHAGPHEGADPVAKGADLASP